MLRTLYKYWVRSSTRSTPFGLFSSWSIGEIGNVDNIELDESLGITRNFRLDMSLLCRIARQLQTIPDIANRILYYSNDSIIRIGEQIHYVEYQTNNGYRTYFLQCADYSEELDKIISLARNGVSISEAINYLCSLNIEQKSAKKFINELIDAQILVCELEICPIGEDPLTRLVITLEKREVPLIYFEKLINYKHLLKTLNCGDTNRILCNQLFNELNNEFNGLNRKYLLQVDSYRKLITATLSRETVNAVEDALLFLSKLTTGIYSENIKLFQKKFYEQYEEQTVPLLTALDQESGIGYPVLRKYDVNEELLQGISFAINESPKSINLSQIDIYILRKIFKYESRFCDEVFLEDDIILDNNSEENIKPASTISALINIVNNTDGIQRINLLSCGGVTASSMIGRISYINPQIEELCSSICSFEQDSMPSNTTIAEIVHMPQDRTGNVIHRRIKRNTEIHYLSVNTDHENCINASDLLLDVKNGKLKITSRKTGNTIIPILSNAHNFHMRPLPVYQFLCDYQYYCFNTIRGINTSNILGLLRYSPRIIYKNIVLSPREWLVNISDFKIKNKDNLTEEIIMKWRRMNNIPNEILVCEYDNELYINFENELSMDVFKDLVVNNKQLKISEIYGTPADFIHGVYGKYRGEICLSFHINDKYA